MSFSLGLSSSFSVFFIKYFGLSSSVWIRFQWTTAYPNSASNPNVWITYGWMIDDVEIVTNPNNDLTVTTTLTSDYNAFASNSFDDNGALIINYDTQSTGTDVLVDNATLDDETADKYLLFWESAENSGVFYNTDDDDNSNLNVASDALRGTTATIDYNDSAQSFVVANDFGVLDMDASSVGDEWNSGEAIAVTLIDQDLNKNTASNEDLLLVNTTTGHLVPSLQIGSPLMTNTVDAAVVANSTYSNIAWYDDVAITADSLAAVNNVTISTGYGGEQMDAIDTVNTYFNFDFTSFNSTSTVSKVCLVSGTPAAGDDVACGDDFEYKGIAEIASPSGLTGGLSVNVTSPSLGSSATLEISNRVADSPSDTVYVAVNV